MTKQIRVSFDDFWKKISEKSSLRGDSELTNIARANTLSELSQLGWVREGVVEASADGLSKALAAGVRCVERAIARHSREEETRKASASARAKLLSAFTKPEPVKNTLSARSQFAHTGPKEMFNPVMAKFDEKCPRCGSAMQAVSLVNAKMAVFCTRDRVVLPVDPMQG